MDYRELLKQYLDGLGSKEINAVAGLYLVGFADWLQRNAVQQPHTLDAYGCSCGSKDDHHTVACYLGKDE